MFRLLFLRIAMLLATGIHLLMDSFVRPHVVIDVQVNFLESYIVLYGFYSTECPNQFS